MTACILSREDKQELDAGFAAAFGGAPERYFSAPGRTEIGGNHTDHQRGRVLAAAVNLDTRAAVRVNGTDTIRILWRYIQANAGELQQVDHVLQRLERATQESKLPEGARAPWQQVDELYLQGLARAGVDPRAVLPQEDDGELYLQAMLERLEERGVRD